MPYRDLSDGQILAATGAFTQFRPTLFACQSHSFRRSAWQFLSRFDLLPVLLGLPIEMQRREVVANCGRSTRNQAVCRQMSLSEIEAEVFKATSEGD